MHVQILISVTWNSPYNRPWRSRGRV